MDDIDGAKALAALEQLEVEKARRPQTKIEAGECVSVRTVVVVGPYESIEDAQARALARHPSSDSDGLAGSQVQTTASSEGPSRPSEEPAASRPPFTCSEPTYVRLTIRNGDDDGDPGAIAEASFTVEDGVVVLRDRDDKHMTSRALLKGQDPAAVARALLREAEGPKSFNHPIRYPKLGLA